MLEAGADVAAETLDGSTGLRFLAKLREEACKPVATYNQLLYVCVSKGAKLSQATKNGGETPLHAACLAGNSVCVSFLLLSKSVDLNATTANGFAALHFAIFSQKTEIVRELLAAGADPALYCKTGSPLQLANAQNLTEIAGMIETAIGRPKTLRPSHQLAHDEVVFAKGAAQSAPVVTGCWDLFRETLFLKSHLVFWLQMWNFVAVLPVRPSSDSAFHGLLIDNSGFSPITVEVQNLALYADFPVAEQLCKYLNSRGDLSKNSSGHLAAINNVSSERIEWKPASYLQTSLSILELETRLCPRRRITIGVVYGKGQETEEQMFLQSSSPKFEKFLSFLGEVFEVGCPTFPSASGFMGGFNESDVGQNFVYTCFAGFEIVLYAAPLLDPARQRQFIGNCVSLIYYKEDGPMENFAFRGAVNSLALVVRPIPVVKNKTPRLDMSGSMGASLPKLDKLAPPSPAAAASGARSPRQRTKKKKARNNRVTLESFVRARMAFKPSLCEQELDLDRAADRAMLRQALFVNCINAHAAAQRTGALGANTSKIFASALAELTEQQQ